jgi:hypothetical protein
MIQLSVEQADQLVGVECDVPAECRVFGLAERNSRRDLQNEGWTERVAREDVRQLVVGRVVIGTARVRAGARLFGEQRPGHERAFRIGS